MLVTLADMKIYLGVSDTSYDTFLTNQIAIISETVEAYCRRKFTNTAFVETFYCEDLRERGKVLDEITCFNYPIISITSVVEKVDDTDTGTAITDYRVHKPSAKLLKRGQYCGNFFTIGNILEVTYNAGYTTVPAPVAGVVYQLVQERYNKKINGIDLNFGPDIQAIAIPGVLNIQYDFSLQNNERTATFGTILGSTANVLDFYRSERAVIGAVRLAYVQ